VNTYVTTKISFANMLARMCEKLPGADVDVVTSALGMDTRIGRKYLKGAVSYGGPCFPRDNQALVALAKSVGAPADLAKATDLFNRGQVTWLAEEALEAANGEAVGILGLTYKPNTDVVEEAAGYLLAQELAKRGAQVTVYDPSGMANSRRVLEGKVTFAASAAECIEKSGAVVVATGWREFSEIPANVWARTGDPRRVLDCWRELKNLEGVEGVTYVRLGNGGAGVLLMQAV
jgi:UDPglucose 6-dehydrogenase